MFKKFSWLYAGLVLFSFFILTNCEDDNNSLGLDLQPPGDKLNVVTSDTASVISYSQLVDSIKTDETSLSLLGSIMDPIFGLSTASFYTQFRLGQSAFSFGTNPYPDSLVLTLDMSELYGDSLAPMTIRVYELDEQILVDTSYYSFHTLAHKPTLLAEKTFLPNFTDSVVVKTDTLPPHLRINLTDITSSLAVKLLTAPSDSMTSNSSFLNYFYGLYVEAQPVGSGGSIIYYNLLSSLSQMTMYYHNLAADSLEFNYLINSNCGRFGHFDHDYSLGDQAFISQVIDKDTTLGQEVCYVQAMAGVKTFIRFPSIKNYYANGPIAVNEARFFLSCAEPEPNLDVADLMIMVKKKEDGSYEFLDDQLNGEYYFGGYYNKNDHGYWFRITSTIQELMKSEATDYGFEIYLSGGSVNSERGLLYGSDPALPDTTAGRMKLVITYTTLN